MPSAKLAFRPSDLIYSLRGPRQVGKTTLIKLEIKRLLAGVPPANIFYYTFDIEDSPLDLVDAVHKYLNRTPNASGRRFMFFDEMSNVRDWQKGMKLLKDSGHLDNCTVVVTGSHSMDVRRATELMQGRRGAAENDDPLDKVLEPMSFLEYVRALDKALEESLGRLGLLSKEGRVELLREMAAGSVPLPLSELSGHQLRLDRHFESYLLTGGMPAVAHEFFTTRTIRSATYEAYTRNVERDLSCAHKDLAKLRRITSSIVRTSGTGVSWRSLGKNTGVESTSTIEAAVDALRDVFAVHLLYDYCHSSRMPRYAAPKKICFRDPFFYHAWNAALKSADPFKEAESCLEHPENRAALAEQIAADHAVRIAFNMAEAPSRFEQDLSVFYWTSKRGREVDIIMYDGTAAIPVDVKYQKQIGRSDLAGIADFRKDTGAKGGIVLTRDTLAVRSGTALVPVPLFALLA